MFSMTYIKTKQTYAYLSNLYRQIVETKVSKAMKFIVYSIKGLNKKWFNKPN